MNHITIIKYSSAIIILVAMVLHVAGATPWNSILQMVGAAGWIYVGFGMRKVLYLILHHSLQ